MKSYIIFLWNLLLSRKQEKANEDDFLGFEAFTRQTSLDVQAPIVRGRKGVGCEKAA